MLKEPKVITVLGTDIQVLFREAKNDPKLLSCVGYFDQSKHLCGIWKDTRKKSFGMKSFTLFCMNPELMPVLALLRIGEPTKKWWIGLQSRPRKCSKCFRKWSWCNV